MTDELASLHVRDLPGVFAARRLGRELAAELGMDDRDQVRVATALSEVSRSAVTVGQTAVIAFGADKARLVLTVTVDGKPPEEGIVAAARLMDTAMADGQVVLMAKRRPQHVTPDLHAVRERLAALLPESTLEELRRNNQDLIATLEDVTQQKEQLLLLNAELQETNRGVWPCTASYLRSLSRPTAAWSRCTGNWTRSPSSWGRHRSPRTGSGPMSATSCGRR